ncbi:MAG: molybdopterin-dependent oxidoreductase [Rhodospirillales bacterium]|nr:molybdopterin-dependent oxidoreductase [Rhodospirillales bacterium]
MTRSLVRSACPHDCPSTCALDIERLDAGTIGRIHGAADNPYTAGVVCAKVARYAERVHNPDRLTRPLRRIGPKGSGRFEAIGWDEALDIVAAAFREATAEHGAEAVWPYNYAGTMGLIQRDGIKRFRHVMGYSRMKETICSAIGRAGWMAGVGAYRGLDPREMHEADLIVLWGGNMAATQVHVMTHATAARKARGAKIVSVDPYANATARAADIHLALRPGTDGALACAVMHVLFRDGFADRDYLETYSDCPERLERHLRTRTPEWAAAITGLDANAITDFARLYGSVKNSFLRLGYGFTRSRNGAVNMHAVSCLPVITGAWRHRGGGALFSNGGLYELDRTLIEGLDARTPGVRDLDMSQIGRVLTGDSGALAGGPSVTAMLTQNTNPAVVAPESALVRRGLAREDLFLCVHEQFMTETAMMADIVLPATTFLEHDDMYVGGGHTFLQVTRRVIEPLGECRSNHEVLQGLAGRLGGEHRGFELSAWEVMDETLRASGLPRADEIAANGGIDCTKPFDEAHYLGGFGWPGGRFRFAPDWAALGPEAGALPPLPDHVAVTEAADDEHPFRLVTAPAHDFLNTSFTETPTSRRKLVAPTALIHPDDCGALGLDDGGRVRLGNRRGSVVVRVRPFAGLQRGVIVVESIWPNADFEEGQGINTLTAADPAPPAGGAVFHDTAVWARHADAVA